MRADTGKRLVFDGGDLAAALAKLDNLAETASFVLGHNLIAFDFPHLQAANPHLRLLSLPGIDTLRLSPLAFPRNPYHRLVKHYQDGALKRGRVNDPELDARLALEVFESQRQELKEAAPDLLTAWHWLTTAEPEGRDKALDAFFAEIRGSPRPSDAEALTAIQGRLADITCKTHRQRAIADAPGYGWALAYALAWLSVAGGNSVMPPWVRHQFPEAGRLVGRLRDTPCGDPRCSWCREHHDATRQLRRWFGFEDFRPAPVDADGRSMQKSIVEAAMSGKHALGILPTGTGKSLCYQIPALSRYDKTGALTVVISPLVALMADQVAGLQKHGIESCVTVNGLLSMPERAEALDKVRLGDAAILLISPEQLRSRSLRRSLEQREIGGWVLDEAHCLSRWGHDFRPDYRYIGRYIGERTGDGPPPPVLCLTATAKPDVIEDIARREVRPHSSGSGGLPASGAAGRRHRLLRDVQAEYFHSKVPPETKKDVQQRFINGDLRAIAATNAFGMGIDKPDVRLVIHADIPGSLESYFQEAGRAGRDRDSARCVLLYAADDVERQFGLSASMRLTRAEIHGVLRALRNLDRKKRYQGEVVATAGEILVEDDEIAFERDSATDDTRVRTAVAWLEESELLSREENVVHIFPSSLLVGSVEEARAKLENRNLAETYRGQLLRIAEALIAADPDEGVTTDELMGLAGLTPEKALSDWAGARASNPWNELLLQAIGEHALETDNAETSTARVIEWLAEWGRDIRRRQRGLLMVTAHRAKSLEFDHVVVLDGGWNAAGRSEDPDEDRRLCYVAMTRARQTLALTRFDATQRLQDALRGHSSVLRRKRGKLPPAAKALEYSFVRPSLEDVDLGFAGRQSDRGPVHRAIAQLNAGDPVRTRITSGGRWELLNRQGMVVGRMAASFQPPAGTRCRSASVLAILGWSREASDPKYHERMRCDAWEVIVPELVFEPEH